MKTIPLTQGQVALVDDADYEAVSQFKWHAQKVRRRFYAARKVKNPDGSWSNQLMHRFLMPEVSYIDHQDGNACNNQRHNLRPATARQNGQGVRLKRIGASSRFRGVSWNTGKSKWMAQIFAEGKQKYLGLFLLEKEAAIAYDKAAIKYFGEFASPNFLQVSDKTSGSTKN